MITPFLVLTILGFSAFAVSLFTVSIWSQKPRSQPKPSPARAHVVRDELAAAGR